MSLTACEEFCGEREKWRRWAVFFGVMWAVTFVGFLVSVAFSIKDVKPKDSTGGSPRMSEGESRITAASAVTKILLSPRVPPDSIILSRVRAQSGNKNFSTRDLAWYKARARRGKLRGQDGKRFVIDQRVARYRTFSAMSGRFGREGTQL